MKTKLFSLTIGCLLSLSLFSQTSYIVQVKKEGSENWSYANEKGEIVYNANYPKSYNFNPDGWAAVYDQTERTYLFVNIKGERLKTEVNSFKIKDGFGFDVDGFSNGLVAIKVENKWGYLNTEGKLVIALKYDHATNFENGFATVKVDESFKVINKLGNETKIECNDIVEIKNFSEGLAPYKSINKNYGFINTDGKVAINSNFESVGYFTNGLAWAKTLSADGVVLLGYINTKGEWIIKPQFTGGKNFDKESGLARVKAGSKWMYINTAGQTFEFNDTESWGDFSNGLAEGQKNKKKGFYNSKGEWVIQPQYEGTREFKNGYAAAKSNGKWGMIDKTGKWIIQPIYERVKDMELSK